MPAPDPLDEEPLEDDPDALPALVVVEVAVTAGEGTTAGAAVVTVEVDGEEAAVAAVVEAPATEVPLECVTRRFRCLTGFLAAASARWVGLLTATATARARVTGTAALA